MGKTLDFSNAGGVILDDGVYVFLIKAVKEKASKTGKDMWLLTFEEEDSKAVIFENYVLEASSAWKVKELLSAVGFEVPKGSMELPDPSDLVGQFVKGKVETEEYNGEPKNSIKKVFAC
jgi:hypothetical protein